MKELLEDFSERAQRYVAGLDARSVAPTAEAVSALARFDEALPVEPTSPRAVLAMLDEIGSPATVATTGGRYFGFVTGGSLPSAMAASLRAYGIRTVPIA